MSHTPLGHFSVAGSGNFVCCSISETLEAIYQEEISGVSEIRLLNVINIYDFLFINNQFLGYFFAN
jgi:hypothetical protein